MTLETKFSAIESEVTDAGIITGYASKFNLTDQGGDTVMPGAYKSSLAVRMPKMLWQHDPSQPIGVWTKAEEDPTGLRVEGKLALGTSKGREAHDLLKMKAIDGLSIGYRTKKADRTNKGRKLVELDLHEVSLVTFPMQIEASVDGVKNEEIMEAARSGDFTPLKRVVEGAMRDAGLPAWQAKALAALSPQILSEGSRDATASEIADAIKKTLRF